jgi:hypothetical protein
MSHDGSYVFFVSPIGLTPNALDRAIAGRGPEGELIYAENVYEWHAGHVYLISDGRDTGLEAGQNFSACGWLNTAVCLLGSDASGRNVFFSTVDSLVPEDTDSQLDYYDARICTTGEPCIKPAAPGLPSCLGEACHGTPAGTPLAPGVPTMTFSGRGNLVSSPTVVRHKRLARRARCAKHKVRVHGRCVKKRARRSRTSVGRRPKRGAK